MHSRSAFTLSRLAAFAIAAVMLSGPSSFAGEPIPAGRVCEWRGDAPICAGECEQGEIAFEQVGDPKYAQHEGFGNPCIGGSKVYCCRLTCPGGYHLEAGTSRERKCVEDRGVPVGTQIITLPKSPVEGMKREKGPIEAPTPIEGTELEKGPIATSEPAPPVPPPVPTPAPEPKPVKIRKPVDVYNKPRHEGGTKIGVLKEETQGVFLVEPLRGDNWYNVKGNVPSGIGWVWSGPGYISLEF